MVLDRLRLLVSHLTSPLTPNSPLPGLSFHVGPTSKPLKHVTLQQLLSEQVALNGDCEALVSAWQGIRWTYRELDGLSDQLAKKFYGLGIRRGDRMGIMAGNCAEYVLTFFASAKIGATLAVINPAYGPEELEFALKTVGTSLLFSSVFRLTSSGTKVFITTPKLNARSHIPLVEHLVPSLTLSSPSPVLPSLTHIIIIDNGDGIPNELSNFLPFTQIPAFEVDLSQLQSDLDEHDVINLQFTSGTTGSPKAAMLTHQYLPQPFLYVASFFSLLSLTWAATSLTTASS